MMPEIHSPAPSTSIMDAGLKRWKTPIPYLFGGLALMLGLIATALIILACSYKKSSTGQSSDDVENKSAKPTLQPEMEPKIVVIMAGDHNPRYLAKPTAGSIRQSEEV